MVTEVATSVSLFTPLTTIAAEAEEEEEDGMDEIDLNNIIEGGRRTRGRVIDFAKAAQENPVDPDEDEDEDDDFQAPDEDVQMGE
jgi:TATA-binding protein-associated factor Taf7